MKLSFDVPFKEQVKYFKSKGIEMSAAGYKELWAEANVHAFTVAKVTKMDVLQDIKDALDEAIFRGDSLDMFREGLKETLTQKGWYAPEGEKATVVMPDGTVIKRLTGWRLDTIYGTNLQSSYQVGRYKQMTEYAKERPYWTYHAVGDPNTRPSHMAQDGKIFPYDDPFWDTWYPPNGYNCRCWVTTSSRVDETKIEDRQPIETPDKGFEYNPGKEAWKPDLRRYDSKLRAEYDRDNG